MRDWQRDRELAMRATPGPWEMVKYPAGERPTSLGLNSVAICGCYDDSDEGYCMAEVMYHSYDCASAVDDAKFIAEAREALPYWLQRVRELEEELNVLRALLRDADIYLPDYGVVSFPTLEQMAKVKAACKMFEVL